jgi:hypothetical protein
VKTVKNKNEGESSFQSSLQKLHLSCKIRRILKANSPLQQYGSVQKLTLPDKALDHHDQLKPENTI